MMRFAWLTFGLAALFALSLQASEERSNLPTRILVTSVTYDDGSGNNLIGPSGICYDPHANEVIVAATGNSRISIYDQNLIPRFSAIHFVTDTTTGGFMAGSPRSVAAMSSGNILVVDNLARYVDVLDFRGTPIERIYPAEVLGQKSLKLRPTAICVDEHDNVYISITGDLECVIVLSPTLELKRQIGQKGQDAETFSTIIAINAADGKLFVTDLYGFPAVKVFDTTGQFIFAFAGHAQENPDLSMPAGVGVVTDTLGEPLIVVPDALRHAIKVYTLRGHLVSILGGYGMKIGEWQYPSGVAIGTNNVFFIVEKGNGRIQRVEIRPPR
jgi:tripartite motif-containing protein 71